MPPVKKNTLAYQNRIASYVHTLYQFKDLVGWYVVPPSIRTSDDYDTVLNTILDLLNLA